MCECFEKLEFRNDFSLYILPFTGSVNTYKSEEQKLYFLRYISESNETSAVKLEPFDELSYWSLPSIGNQPIRIPCHKNARLLRMTLQDTRWIAGSFRFFSPSITKMQILFGLWKDSYVLNWINRWGVFEAGKALFLLAFFFSRFVRRILCTTFLNWLSRGKLGALIFMFLMTKLKRNF